MYRITKFWLTVLFFIPSLILSQNKNEDVYLLFDVNKEENCEIDVEGKGIVRVDKYRKECEKDIIWFYLCDERFGFYKKKKKREILSDRHMAKYNLVDIDYLKTIFNSSNTFKHHVVKKIYIIEVLPNNEYAKYEVNWTDEMILIED